MAQRDYTTWEEDLCGTDLELWGLNNELVATVQRYGGSWIVKDADGQTVGMRPDKTSAMLAAEALVKR